MPWTCSRNGVGILALEHFGLDPVELDADLVCDPAVVQRLDERLVGVLHARVLADDGDGDFALGIVDALGHGMPALQVRLGCGVDAEGGEDFPVQPGFVIGVRHGIDRRDVARLDDGALADVAEQAELAALLAGNFAVGAAQQDIGLDADGAQLLHGVLRRLGLQFAGRGNVGQQGQVNVDGMPARQVVAELADGLEERKPLDIAHRAADLDEHEVHAFIPCQHELLDGVCDVRDHLHRAAEVVAAPLLGDDVLVDPAGGDVVGTRCGPSREALVMAEVEIGLRSVVSDEDLAVLIGAHRARIDVEIRVELPESDRIAASLKESAEGGRSQTLAERRNHATGDEYVPSHGVFRLRPRDRFVESGKAAKPLIPMKVLG